MSVRNTPGATALTVIPCGAHSTARPRVNPASPDLLAPYAATSCSPTNEEIDAMPISRPLRCAIIDGTNAR